jgi:hypothetical protein
VSEATIGTAPAAGGGKAKPKAIMGMPPIVFYGAVAGVAALAWMVYRSRKASAASASSGQGASTGSCTDANGNPTPCEELAGVDYSGQLSTEQTELEALLAQNSPPPTPAATTVQQYPAVSFQAQVQNATTILVTFTSVTNPTPVPTSYTVTAMQLNGKTAFSQSVNAPDSATASTTSSSTTGGTTAPSSSQGQVTINGLVPTWCYKITVQANGATTPTPGIPKQVCMPSIPSGNRGHGQGAFSGGRQGNSGSGGWSH